MKQVHVNEIKIGDTIIVFDDVQAVVTGLLISGKGYQRVYGYFTDEPWNPTLLINCNCFVNLVTGDSQCS